MLKKKRRIDPSKKKKTGVLNLTTSIRVRTQVAEPGKFA
jgi:hypothetical protein